MTTPSDSTAFNPQKVKGRAQIEAIVRALNDGDRVIDSGGRVVLVGGRQFLRKHYVVAIDVYKRMVRMAKEEAQRAVEPKKGTLRRIVEGLFLGKK